MAVMPVPRHDVVTATGRAARAADVARPQAAPRADPVHQKQVLLDIPDAIHPERRPYRPDDQRCGRCGGDESEPEPQEEKDLLVEEVDREDALHGVALHGAETSYPKVAHRHAWEPLRHGPIGTGHDGADHLDAVEVKVLAEEEVESEELYNGVGNEEQFDAEVHGGEIVALATAAAGARERAVRGLAVRRSQTRQESACTTNNMVSR